MLVALTLSTGQPLYQILLRAISSSLFHAVSVSDSLFPPNPLDLFKCLPLQFLVSSLQVSKMPRGGGGDRIKPSYRNLSFYMGALFSPQVCKIFPTTSLKTYYITSIPNTCSTVLSSQKLSVVGVTP